MENKCLNCDYYNMKGKFYLTGDWSVYKHTTPNRKAYIGITSRDPKKRWHNGEGYKNNKHFYRAINKYGWDNIEHKILFNNFTEKMAKLMEQCLIVLYDAFNKEFGYNLTLGGEGVLGYIHSEETKKKISESHKGENHSEETKKKMSELHNGKNHSEETKKKMSELQKGKNHSEETKKKMSELHKGENNPMYGKNHSEETKKKLSESKKGENNPMYGKNHSEETRKKISDSKKGKHLSEETKKKLSIKVICLTTNKIFDSMKIAAKFYNTDASAICKCCKGKQKFCGKNPITGESLRWAYAD